MSRLKNNRTLREQPDRKHKSIHSESGFLETSSNESSTGEIDVRNARGFDQHAALLGDTRSGKLSDTLHRAMVVRELQRNFGNRYVSRLLDHVSRRNSTGIQTKMTVGPAGDKYEREADQVAKQVLGQMKGTGEQPVQRQGMEEEELQMKPLQRQGVEEEELQMKPLQRQGMEEEELQMKPLQRQIGMEGGDVGPELEQSVERSRGKGQALPEDLRRSMEGPFGVDFSGVRVHTDAQAHDLNDSISARAFTTGQDIFFRKGEYNPSSADGKEILAHELTHVVQQSPGRTLSDDNSDYERETVPVKRQVVSDGGWLRWPFSSTKDEDSKATETSKDSKATEESKGLKLEGEDVKSASEFLEGLLSTVQSSFSDIQTNFSAVATEEKKDAGMTDEAASEAGLKDFKSRNPFIASVTEFFEGLGGKIVQGVKVVPQAVIIFSSVLSAIEAYKDRKKEFMALDDLQRNQAAAAKDSQDTGPTEFAQAVSYSVKKAFRSAISRAMDLAASVVQGIVRASGLVTAMIPGGLLVTAVLAAIDIGVGVVKMLKTVGEKAKGFWKWVTGTRGVAREKNAGVIVDTAMSGTSEAKDAATLIGSLKPAGLIDLISSNPEEIMKALNDAGPESDLVIKLKEGMADKIKSS